MLHKEQNLVVKLQVIHTNQTVRLKLNAPSCGHQSSRNILIFLNQVPNFEGHVCYFEFVNQLSGYQQSTVRRKSLYPLKAELQLNRRTKVARRPHSPTPTSKKQENTRRNGIIKIQEHVVEANAFWHSLGVARRSMVADIPFSASPNPGVIPLLGFQFQSPRYDPNP